MVGTYANNDRHAAESTVAREQLDERITELVDIIRANQQRIERLETRTKRVKEQLHDLLQQRGENWSDQEGYARLVAEGERTAYDTAALDELIVREPLRYGWLKDYRRKISVSGGVRVK